ncbi:WYL domain-containing protein [Cellulomonas sp. ATA003]|uniref:WYL domain-containing protein n=1 Tax=Cellulomonas sp. ATA003 TaxID=3073064 RepID=UPI0028737BD0|nr:WYL domain-containing protein [Cellulomonas sp. ATA003]WNB87425.1 WYL domain-containing protein [Cellulomonas sp. ATA003]
MQRAVTEAPYRHLARVRLRAPADHVRALVPPQVGRVEDDGDGWCVLLVGGDDLDSLALHVAGLGLEAQVVDPPQLRDAARRLARRAAAMGEG